MKVSVLAVVSVGVTLATSAISSAAATRHAGAFVMGTVLEATVVADDQELARRMAARSVDIAKHWEDVLTIWQPDGELARFNQRAGSGPVDVSQDLRFALKLMLRLSGDTQGAFDPAVGPLVAYFSASHLSAGSPPRSAPLSKVLRIAESKAELDAGAMLDPGGIGKGIALDAIARELRISGLRGAYVDFGGSSQFAFGRNESGEPWQIALSGASEGHIVGIFRLDGFLSTSRSRAPGDLTGPIVDPRSSTVVSDARLATCVAESAAAADAWSTALIVTGPAALSTIEKHAVGALVATDHGVYVTPGFAHNLRPTSDEP